MSERYDVCAPRCQNVLTSLVVLCSTEAAEEPTTTGARTVSDHPSQGEGEKVVLLILTGDTTERAGLFQLLRTTSAGAATC